MLLDCSRPSVRGSSRGAEARVHGRSSWFLSEGASHCPEVCPRLTLSTGRRQEFKGGRPSQVEEAPWLVRSLWTLTTRLEDRNLIYCITYVI
jgi:hypothetical protein